MLKLPLPKKKGGLWEIKVLNQGVFAERGFGYTFGEIERVFRPGTGDNYTWGNNRKRKYQFRRARNMIPTWKRKARRKLSLAFGIGGHPPYGRSSSSSIGVVLLFRRSSLVGGTK